MRQIREEIKGTQSDVKCVRTPLRCISLNSGRVGNSGIRMRIKKIEKYGGSLIIPKDPTIAVGTSGFGLLEMAPPLRERAYAALEEMIVDGVFPPGLHLKEDDLAKRLGVSRNPVREALQGLVREGLADYQPGKGVFVHAPSRREVEEVFQTRALLEGESARLSAGHISSGALESMKEILELGHRAVLTEDAQELLKLNEQFHNVIIGAANNSIMAAMMVPLQRRIRWYFSRVVVSRAPGSWNQHNEIYQAICDGDGEGASKKMVAHIMQTRQSILDKFDEAAGESRPRVHTDNS